METIRNQFCVESIDTTDSKLANDKFETNGIDYTESNDNQLSSVDDTNADQSVLVGVQTLKKMNIDRPVVSSCIALTSSDKCHLSEICRQLIEPSAHLVNLSLEQLELPKYSAKLQNMPDSFIYNQKNFELLQEKRQHSNSDNLLKKLTIKEYLQNKIPNNCPLYAGDVILNGILSKKQILILILIFFGINFHS